MTTWDEIRDEVAGMLADGKPLEEVIGKLEQRKNEMAKANLIAVMDEMKKPKPMTNEEHLKSLDTEQLAEWLGKIYWHCHETDCQHCKYPWRCMEKGDIVEWLKQPHCEKE